MKAKLAKTQPTKAAPSREAASTATASPATGPLHTWQDGDGRGIWHYCGLCKVIRYPNGKLDTAVCPGAHAPKISPKYVKSDKSSSAKTKPARRPTRPTKSNPSEMDQGA